MRAADVVQDLHRAGMALTTDGSKLTVTRSDRLTPPLRDAIRAHKRELIELVEAAQRTTARLLMHVAMLRCDQLRDSDKAREAMREDVLATPLHLRPDLLDHFTQVTKGAQP